MRLCVWLQYPWEDGRGGWVGASSRKDLIWKVLLKVPWTRVIANIDVFRHWGRTVWRLKLTDSLRSVPPMSCGWWETEADKKSDTILGKTRALGTRVLSSPTDKRIPTRNSFGTFGDCSMTNWRWWWNPGSASFKAATPNWHGPRPTQTPQTVSQASIFTVPRDYPYLIERLSRSFSSSVAAREHAHTPIYYVWAFAIFACQMEGAWITQRNEVRSPELDF